jgi:hypothetical protein
MDEQLPSESPPTVNKKCTKCNLEKPVTEFRKQKTTKDGLMTCCKSCHTEMSKAHYLKHKKGRVFQVRLWQLNNKEKVKSYHQKYNNNKST